MDAELEIVRSQQDLWETRDVVAAFRDDRLVAAFSEAMRAICTDDFEVEFISGPAGLRTTYEGIGGLIDGFRDWTLAFESFRIEQEGDPIAGERGIVAPARQTGTLPGGGEVAADAIAVFYFRDRRVRRIEFHANRGEAYRAAGVSG